MKCDPYPYYRYCQYIQKKNTPKVFVRILHVKTTKKSAKNKPESDSVSFEL